MSSRKGCLVFDGEAFGNQMVEIVRGYVVAELEPLRAENKALAEANASLAERVALLEAREVPEVTTTASLTEEQVGSLIAEAIKALPEIPDAEELRRIADEAATEAVKALPAPEKGDPGEVDMDAVKTLVEQAAKTAVEALPKPQDGKDGLGLANALIDRDGCLVVTFSDGSDKNLGRVIGKDGEDGKDGHTFTLDDFDIIPLDERTIKMGFTHGEVMHSFELAMPALIYRGVFKEGETYAKGDMVTWAGSIWHCDNDTSGKPDGEDWTLAVKRGRDGKDAK